MDNVILSPYSSLEIEEVSLPDLMLRQFRKFGNKTAIICPDTGKQYTFSELVEWTHRLSSVLDSLGLRKGDVLGIVSLNSPDFFPLSFAAQLLGGAVTTANPAFTRDELIKQFLDSSVKIVVTELAFLDLIRSAQTQCPPLKTVIVRDHGPTDSGLPTGAVSLNLEMTKSSYTSACLPSPARPRYPKLDLRKDSAFILYSSGTTGLPKGVELTHHSLVSNIFQASLIGQKKGSREGMFLWEPGKVVYGPFPFFHLGGIHLNGYWPLASGSTLVVLPKYDPDHVLAAIQEHKITSLMLPPPVLVFLAKSPLLQRFDVSSLKEIICGAAPIPPEAVGEVRKRIPQITTFIQLYGMTELSPLSHVSLPEDGIPSSCGKLLPGTKCKIVDLKTGKSCKALETGEIWIQGPQVMKGYLNNPSATAATITTDGWLKTGDIGYYDEKERFYIVDRLKELIKVRGFQVAPAELEALILTHPGVAEVIVIGIPDPYSQELPRAYVVPKEGCHPTEMDIVNHVADHAVKYKHLKGGVVFVEGLPKTGSGKLLRRMLRDQARKEAQIKGNL